MKKNLIFFNKYDIKDLLSCPICLDYFHNPKIILWTYFLYKVFKYNYDK